MRYSIPLSDAFIPVVMQEDAQTRSNDHAHGGETRVVWELTVARRRRHRQGRRAGVEVAPVAANDGAQADDSPERGKGLAVLIASLRTALPRLSLTRAEIRL
jgi:hypothetical protein